MKISRLFVSFIASTFLLVSCSGNGSSAVDRSSQQSTVEGYISRRYTNDYDYKEYCVFKTGAVPA